MSKELEEEIDSIRSCLHLCSDFVGNSLPSSMNVDLEKAFKSMDIIEQTLEKQDKVLAILEEKRVDISLLVHLITSSVYDDSFVAYNNFMSNILTSIDRADKILTKEEFNLLKEWLNE